MNIECTNCQSKIRVPESAAGKTGKCPKCGTLLTIPAASGPPAAEAAAVPEVPTTAGYASTPLPPPLPPPLLPSAPPPVPKASRRAADESPRRSRFDEDDEGDDLPSRRDDDLSIRRPRRSESIAMGLTSMIVGIAGLLVSLGFTGASIFLGIGCPCLFYGGYIGVGLGGLLAILALVFGFVGLYQGGRGYALAGLIAGGLNVVVILLYILATVVLGVVIVNAANQNQPQPQFGPPPQPPIFVPNPPPGQKFKKF